MSQNLGMRKSGSEPAAGRLACFIHSFLQYLIVHCSEPGTVLGMCLRCCPTSLVVPKEWLLSRKSVLGNREMLREKKIYGRDLTGEFTLGWQGKLAQNFPIRLWPMRGGVWETLGCTLSRALVIFWANAPIAKKCVRSGEKGWLMLCIGPQTQFHSWFSPGCLGQI